MGTAVAGVDLAVARGETFGLIGPDGAGKTTLTRVLLGLLARTGGESRVLGHDSMTRALRHPRAGGLHRPALRPAGRPDGAGEPALLRADVQGVSRADQRRRIPELLEFAGLSEFTGRLAGRLSGGMKKKLALACSLIHEPEVVLLDEPTLGVDPVSRREFWNLLGNLRAEKGLTIFVCTPYMDEAERCSRVGLMYGGRLIACDTPAAIKRRVPGRLLEFTPSRFRAGASDGRRAAGRAGGADLRADCCTRSWTIPRCGGPQIEAALAAQGIAVPRHARDRAAHGRGLHLAGRPRRARSRMLMAIAATSTPSRWRG